MRFQFAVREEGERLSIRCPERLIRVSADLGAGQEARIRIVEPPVPQHDAAPLVWRPERDLGAIGRNGRRRNRKAAVWGRGETHVAVADAVDGITASTEPAGRRDRSQSHWRRSCRRRPSRAHGDGHRRGSRRRVRGSSDSSANATSRALSETLGGLLEAVTRRFDRAPAANRRDTGRVGWIVTENHRHRIGDRFALERAAARQHFVEMAPRAKMSARVDGLPAHLPGAMPRRAHHDAGVRASEGLPLHLTRSPARPGAPDRSRES